MYAYMHSSLGDTDTNYAMGRHVYVLAFCTRFGCAPLADPHREEVNIEQEGETSEQVDILSTLVEQRPVIAGGLEMKARSIFWKWVE